MQVERLKSGSSQRRTRLLDSEVIGFIKAAPPEKLSLMVATVAMTSQGRAAVLRTASEITGVDLAEMDDDPQRADEIDTASLVRASGDMLTSAGAAARLGQTRQNINELLKGQRILGVRFGSRWRFPSAQFRHHELLPGLAPVLKAMGDLDPWRMLEVLLAPSEPAGLRPIELLRVGDKAKALAIASRKAAAFRVADGTVGVGGVNAALDTDLEADLRRDREIDCTTPFATAT